MKNENTVENLKAAFETFSVKHSFKPGDIVRWKDGLKNKASEGPFIVVEVLPEPIFDTFAIPVSPYFRERLDILLGKIEETEGAFLILHYDSRRLEPVESA